MRLKKIVCLLLALLVTGCSTPSLSLSSGSHEYDPISINDDTTTTTTTTTTAKVSKTTKETGHNIINTIWEFVGNNGNYKYIYFKSDSTGIDDFSYYVYDTSSRYKTSACHFQGFGNITSNETKNLDFQLDNGEKFIINWINKDSFSMDNIRYTKVSNSKIALVDC